MVLQVSIVVSRSTVPVLVPVLVRYLYDTSIVLVLSTVSQYTMLYSSYSNLTVLGTVLVG